MVEIKEVIFQVTLIGYVIPRHPRVLPKEPPVNTVHAINPDNGEIFPRDTSWGLDITDIYGFTPS